MSKITINKVSKSNFENFFELILELAKYEKLTPPEKKAKARLKKDVLSKKNSVESYLVYYNKQPVGYAILFYTYSSFLALPTLYLEDIFILEEYRKKGVGQEMFDFCKKLAKKKDCGRMEWAVLDWNTPAIKFYEKNKAKPLKDWIYYRLTKEQL